MVKFIIITTVILSVTISLPVLRIPYYELLPYPYLSISSLLPSIVDFNRFRAVGGEECYDALELGFERMHELWDAGEYETLTEIFYLCDPLEEEDGPLFFSVLAEFYAILPQFESQGFIQTTCDNIIDNNSSIASIANILSKLIDIDGGECLDLSFQLEL